MVASLTGCSLKGDFYSSLSKSTPYLSGSAAIITQVVLSEAVSVEDRKSKAKTVLQVAALIEEMTANGDVSLETFGLKLSYFIPDKSYWHEFSAGLILLYADIYAQSKELDPESRTKILIKALNKIAYGCKVAAENFD
jgi:hypothetical protein